MTVFAAFAVGALTVVTVAAAGKVTTQTADLVGQAIDPPVDVLAGAATIQRSDSGISAKVKIPTPTDYTLPPMGNPFLPAPVAGFPEAFSLWMFVFNFPGLCSPAPPPAPACGADDLGSATAAKGGGFNAGGHIVGGPTLSLSGHVSMNTAPVASAHSAMLDPRGAEVHLAIAPHGGLVPELLPELISKPIGSSPFWWIAVFNPPPPE